MVERREDYVKSLEEYYKKQKINVGANFYCEHKNECKNAAYRGAEAYVGEKYGEPFKVLVASLDLGNAKANLEERFRQIKDLKEDKLNPHMRGTLKTLEVIFSDELKTKEVTEPFKNFALTNTAKCCLGTMAQAPWEFFNNCKEYTKGEVDILDPDIIVSQGECASAVFELLYPKLKSQDTWDGKGIKWLEKEGEITLRNNHKVGIICSVHPAVKNNRSRSAWDRFIKVRLPEFIKKWRQKIKDKS